MPDVLQSHSIKKSYALNLLGRLNVSKIILPYIYILHEFNQPLVKFLFLYFAIFIHVAVTDAFSYVFIIYQFRRDFQNI
jgi:hypothetical protein